MKNIRTNKFFILTSTLILLAGCSFAAESFQNSLVKMDFYESSSGGIKVNLYTSKPYKDAIKVNKKSDFEYTILMPETSSSITAKPALKSTSNYVKNVDVKTQQYANQLKGYTKIVIATTKAIDIVPVAQTLSLSESKTANASKKITSNTTTKKSTVKQNLVPQNIKAQLKHEINKSAQKLSRVQTKVKSQAIVQKTIQKVMPQKPKQVVNIDTKLTPAKKTATNVTAPVKQKEQVLPAKKINQPPVNQIKENQIKTQPKQSLDNNIKPSTEPESKVQTNKIPKSIESENQDLSTTEVEKPQELGFIPKLKQDSRIWINKIKSNSNIFVWAGIILIPLIFLLLIIKSLGQNAKKIKQHKAEFMAHLNDAPLNSTDYTEKINDDMNWQEKFETYVNTPSSQTENADSSVISDIMLDDDILANSTASNVDTLYEDSAESSIENDITEDNMEQENQYFQQVNIDESGQEFEETNILDELSNEENQVTNNYYEEDSVLDELSQIISQDETENEDVSVEDIFEEDELEDNQNLDDFVLDNVEENIYEEPEETTDLDELTEESNVEEIENFQEETTQEVLPETAEDGLYTEEIVEETPTPVVEDIVKSEYAIDEEKGFYLVDIDDSTALVGHIADEVFVLKKFDSKIDGKIQARVDEKKGSSTNYMTRVGSFKALVEVTNNMMNLLIEL